MFPYSVALLLSVFILFELSVCQVSEVITEAEKVFRDLMGAGSDTKRNKFFQIIFPGTRWCGDGDRAESEDDLGKFEEVDACCREHDLCPDVIFAGKSKHGLSNNGFFSRLGCSCDEKFYKCLSSLCSPLAASIGITYFDVLRPNCFTYDHPIHCTTKESHRVFGDRCINYEVCKNQSKIWHWREPVKFDFSTSSEHLLECFKNVTREKMETTHEAVAKFIYVHGIEPLLKICSMLSPESWFRNLLCSKIIPILEDKFH